MLEERVNTLEATLRRLMTLGIIRDEIVKRDAEEAKAAAEAKAEADKQAEIARIKLRDESRAAAIAAAKAEGREPPTFPDDPPPQPAKPVPQPAFMRSGDSNMPHKEPG